MRRPKLEPSQGYLSHLRNVFDLEAINTYIEDPQSTARLRRRAALTIAGTAPGGGRAGAFFGNTDPAVIPYLAPLVDDPDPAVRRAAAFGLRRTNDPAAIEPLMRALADSDEATRKHAIWGLGDLRCREAVEPICQLLHDKTFASMAAQALARIGDERAIGHLRLAANEPALWQHNGKQIEGALTDLEFSTGMRQRR